ncbi:hypothetical protein Q5752_004389 [Cryptotrichosporon argae]
MVTLTALDSSTIIFVGIHGYPLRVATDLVGRGLSKVVLVDSPAKTENASGRLRSLSPTLQVTVRTTDDPLALIAAEPELFTSSNLVVAADQPRPVEEALGTLLWTHEAADVPLLISRKVAFNAKMRAQYRTWTGIDKTTFNGSNLDGPPKDAWTEAKGALLAHVLCTKQGDGWKAHCVAGLAAREALRSIVPPPSPNDTAALSSPEGQEAARQALRQSVQPPIPSDQQAAEDALALMLAGGYDQSTVTTEIMAALLAWDAEALVTGVTCPLNSCTIEQAYEAGSKALAPKATTNNISHPALALPDDATERELFAIVRRERLARDTGDFDTLASLHWPDSVVRVTWFEGLIGEFIDVSRDAHQRGRGRGLHVIKPIRADVAGDRALVESQGEIHIRPMISGTQCDVVSWCRFFSRLERRDGVWRMITFDSIYCKDRIDTVLPDAAASFHLDQARLDAGRASYRHLRYLNLGAGFTVPDNLPGDDKPELVAEFYKEASAWLHQEA